MIEEAASDTPWDMAPGTSRWSLYQPGSSVDVYSSIQCWLGWEPLEGLPKTTADLGILEVQGRFPERIELWYGWVIQEPPTVSVRIVNLIDRFVPSLATTPRTMRGASFSSGMATSSRWETSPDIDRWGSVGTSSPGIPRGIS